MGPPLLELYLHVLLYSYPSSQEPTRGGTANESESVRSLTCVRCACASDRWGNQSPPERPNSVYWWNPDPLLSTGSQDTRTIQGREGKENTTAIRLRHVPASPSSRCEIATTIATTKEGPSCLTTRVCVACRSSKRHPPFVFVTGTASRK